MNGKTRNICHSSSCIREPACRHPSSASLRSAASPRGKPRGGCRSWHHSIYPSVPETAGGFEPPLQVRGKPVVRCAMKSHKLLSYKSHKILSYNPPLDKRCKICYLEAATEQYLQGGAKFPTGGNSPRTHLRRIGEIPIPTV